MKSNRIAAVALIAGFTLLPVWLVPPASAVPLTYTQISSGLDHTCALVSDGSVKCWGLNDYGQLGNNSTTNSSVPVHVSGLTGVTQISTGAHHTCALVSGGAIKCWGRNDYGQFGNNSTTSSSVPVDGPVLTGVTQISAGGHHTCALVSGGAVKCWGQGDWGQLGNNSTADSPVPVDVSSLTGATQISAGYEHTCALVSGVVKCWGYGYYGQLGNNSTSDSWVPVDVSGITDATRVAAGGEHACALVSGGGAKCWGLDLEGQLGDNSTTNSSVPVAVWGLTGATGISASLGSNTCAIVASGGAKCWGRNPYGQLGNGTSGTGTYSSVPVDVVLETTALSINAPRKVAAGRKAKITGVLSSPDVTCTPSQQVALLKGTTTVGTATTDATGAYKFTLTIKKKTTIQVTSAGNVWCAPSASAATTIRAV